MTAVAYQDTGRTLVRKVDRVVIRFAGDPKNGIQLTGDRFTSEEGKVTKSTPMGSLDHSFNPVWLVLGAEASRGSGEDLLSSRGPGDGLGIAVPMVM